MSKIKVMLVDDHEMVRLGLKSFLNLHEDVEVIAEADDGEDGLEKALSIKPISIMRSMSCHSFISYIYIF